MDVREQRVRFVVAALRREMSFSSLCVEFGVFRPTGRLWLRRYCEHGVDGIADHSRTQNLDRGATAEIPAVC